MIIDRKEVDLWISVTNFAIEDLRSRSRLIREDAKEFLLSKECQEIVDTFVVFKIDKGTFGFRTDTNGYNNESIYHNMIKNLKKRGLL